MQKYFNNVVDQQGNAINNASVTVTKGLVAASLYSDNGVTLITGNVVKTDARGYFEFYAADGRYNLAVSGTGIAAYTLSDVLLEDTPGNLAAPGGSALVGNDAETVADSFNALQLADYAALRASVSPRKSVYITGYLVSAAPTGIAGMFIRDDNDTTSADNNATIIVRADGKRYKRVFSGSVDVQWFGVVAGTNADMGAKTAAANTYAASINADLEFPGGEILVGSTTSFTIDPTKTRWIAHGPCNLRWTASPVAGFAVNIVSSEATPYETVRRQVGRIIDGISIIGSQSSGTKFSATGLKIGDDIHQTNTFTISHATVSGWTNIIDFRNNTWWITFEKCRLMWGTITTPVASGNWGENNVFRDTNFIDGVVFAINYGEWKLYGGSLDNSQIIANNYAYVAWFGPHLENPGTVTLSQPFIDIQGTEATAMLVAPELVIDNNGSAITTAPFNVAVGNTQNGLILDGLQYTQGGFAAWYSMVSGGGRVRVRSPQILAFGNANYQVIAENAVGQLRNYGFSTGDTSGWTSSFTGTGTAAASSVRARTGTYSCLLTATSGGAGYADATIKQKVSIQSGQFLMMKFAYSRNYTGATGGGAITGQIVWLDAAGSQITTSSLGFYSAATATDDGAVFNPLPFNGIAPGGTVQAEVQITVQRPSGTGSALLYVDDVFVNVVS